VHHPSDAIGTEARVKQVDSTVLAVDFRSPAQLLDGKRCAALLGISQRSWQRLVATGAAPAKVSGLGGSLARWRLADLEAFVARLPAAKRAA
jgi:predicted DNA-binding transcriptional regulator AlpA